MNDAAVTAMMLRRHGSMLAGGAAAVLVTAPMVQCRRHVPHEPPRRRVPDLTTAAIVAISVATFAICAHRAAIQAISHDEAYAYEHVILASWLRVVFHSGVPNHALIVLAIKALLVWL